MSFVEIIFELVLGEEEEGETISNNVVNCLNRSILNINILQNRFLFFFSVWIVYSFIFYLCFVIVYDHYCKRIHQSKVYVFEE